MKEFMLENRNRIVASALAVGLAAGAAVDANEVYNSLRPTPNVLATAPCNTVPEQQVDAMASELREDFTKHPYGNLWSDEMSALPKKLHLHLLSPDELPKFTADAEPSIAINSLSNFTLKKYGFTVTGHPEVPQATQDAMALERSLINVPVELVKAAGLHGIEINRETIQEEGDFDPITKTIRLSSGQAVDTFAHELGHGLADASAEKLCGTDVALGDPSLIDADPAGFKYDGSSKEIAWRNVTATRYGASDNAEDSAEMSREILSPELYDEHCIYNPSADVIDKKLAIILARYEELAPGTGKFAAATMLARTPCS